MTTLNDTKLNDIVVFKDPGFGKGRVLGYNHNIGKHLIGYMRGNVIPKASWKWPDNGAMLHDRDGNFVYREASMMSENGQKKIVCRVRVDCGLWVDSTLEVEVQS